MFSVKTSLKIALSTEYFSTFWAFKVIFVDCYSLCWWSLQIAIEFFTDFLIFIFFLVRATDILSLISPRTHLLLISISMWMFSLENQIITTVANYKLIVTTVDHYKLSFLSRHFAIKIYSQNLGARHTMLATTLHTITQISPSFWSG